MKGLDPFRVLLTPFGQGRDGIVERGAELGHRILHPRRNFVEDLTVNYSVRLHLPELLN